MAVILNIETSAAATSVALTAEGMVLAHQEDMEQIPECLHCNQCKERCPYGLDTPALLEKNLKDYREQLKK